jgi:hypothetical protein
MEHHVYFWLKDEHKNDEDLAEFEAGLAELCESETIMRSKWGKPAATEERAVTDHSWDYGLSLRFRTLDDHNTYQADDPHHQAFIDGFKDFWSEVLIMDLA